MSKKIKLAFDMFLLKRTIKKKMQEIEKALPEEFRFKFRSNCFLAGGAIRNLMIGKKVKDWDIFFNADSDKVTQFIEDLGNYYGHPNMIIQYKSDNALSLLINGEPVQFIGKKFAGDPDYVISRFDFTNSIGYYDIGDGKLVITEEMEEACLNKTLKFNEDAFSPELSPKRAAKFIKGDWSYCTDWNWYGFRTATGYSREMVDYYKFTAPKTGSKEDSESYE